MDFSSLLIEELYTDQLSYYPGDKVKIYCSTHSIFSLNKEIELTNVAGDVVGHIEIKIEKQEKSSLDVLQDGLNYNEFSLYTIPTNFKSGIYLINHKYPLIVKSKEASDITVVYPFMNNILYEPVKGESVFSEKALMSSFLRSASIDKYSKGMLDFFNYLNTNYKVNYLTDIDLEQRTKLNNTKLLILYGKSTCWTTNMKESFKSYLTNKGNVLVMTSYSMNNICWFNRNDNAILMYDEHSSSIKSWANYNGENPEKIIGISYNNGGYSKNSDFVLANETHPILKGIDEKTIIIKATLFSSPPVNWFDDLPRLDLDSIGFYNGEIIAYNEASYKIEQQGIKGIFILQPDSISGKIVSLGTEDWCLKENIQNNKDIQRITLNAVEYLTK